MNSKKVSDSSMTASYKVTPDMASADGKLFGGELLKLVDVMAGVAARTHADYPTVTVSVENNFANHASRVIFITEVRVGDTIHLSVSINRTWNTSMETGVRCLRQERKTGEISYACHAYLTFVAVPGPQPQQPPNVPKSKITVPSVIRQSLMEEKRYILAGRRRQGRIQRRAAWDELLSRARLQFFEDIYQAKQAKVLKNNNNKDNSTSSLLHLEIVADAYFRKDGDVKMANKESDVQLEIEGSTVIFPLEKILGHIEATKKKQDISSSPVSPTLSRSLAFRINSESPMSYMDTHILSIHIVRPQHTNSMSNLFGGQLMYWLEQASEMSANKLSNRSWVTACLDSMVFKESIKQGQVVHIHAVVTKVWKNSIEVYCVACSEPWFGGSGDNNATPQPQTTSAQEGKQKFAAQAFLTLVAINTETGLPDNKNLRQLEEMSGAMGELAGGADQRRQERLDDKSILMAVYV